MAKKSRIERLTSLDEPLDGDLLDTALDIGAGFTPLQYPQAARDFERARRADDTLGMGLAGLAAIPVVGGIAKAAGKLRKTKKLTEAPAVNNLLYPDTVDPITGKLNIGWRTDYVPGEVLPKWGMRNLSSAELDDILEKGFMLPGGRKTGGRGGTTAIKNAKYFTMTDNPRPSGTSKQTVRVASENLPFDRAVRAEHVEVYDPELKDWIPLLNWAKVKKRAGGMIENTTHDRKLI